MEINKKINPFYAIYHEYIQLPEDVMPWAPTWSPDGEHILFHDYNGGREWIVDADGKNLKCITEGMEDRPDIIGGFYYILPDNKRMFISDELGDSAYILECEPDLYTSTSYKWLKIDISGDQVTGKPVFGRRTYHLAPDGIHLAYNVVRPDGLIMLVCRLEREADRYVAKDYRVVNPHGPKGPEDTDQEGWANSGTLCELKSFAEGGASIIFVSESGSGNIDQFKMNLLSGEITQLTYDEDWDEDGAFAPDGSSIVCASWRTMHRLDSLTLMPLTPPFLNMHIGAALAVHYVSSQPGFASELQPWLLSAQGDTERKLKGQPLGPYKGGKIFVANNLSGLPFWSPDSTKILLQERMFEDPAQGANKYVLEKGPAPNRLLIARIERPATTPIPVVETKIGDWATTLEEYCGSFDFQGVHTVNGYKSGTATLTIDGNMLGGKFKAEFHNFSNDGLHFLNGIEYVESAGRKEWKMDLTATDLEGKEIGSVKGDLVFQAKQPAPPRNIPPTIVTGSVTSTWKGITRSGLPGLDKNTACMPAVSPLFIGVDMFIEQDEIILKVHVSADVYGDLRPVAGAEVEACGITAKSDDEGTATLQLPLVSNTLIRVTATAGDTFTPATTAIVC